MNFEIKSRNIELSDRDQSMINRRAAFCFSRLNQIVKKVTITIEDINGPKGGVDMECRARVQLTRAGSFVVSVRRSHLSDAIDGVLQRASYHALQRNKRRQKRTQRSIRRLLTFVDEAPMQTYQ